MFNLKNVVIFVAGMQFFHTLDHIFLAYVNSFPLNLKIIVLTSTFNTVAIIINAITTVALLWWASRLSKKCSTQCRPAV